MRRIALLLRVRDGLNMAMKFFVVPTVIGVIIGVFAYALGNSEVNAFNLGLSALVGGLFVQAVSM